MNGILREALDRCGLRRVKIDDVCGWHRALAAEKRIEIIPVGIKFSRQEIVGARLFEERNHLREIVAGDGLGIFKDNDAARLQFFYALDDVQEFVMRHAGESA